MAFVFMFMNSFLYLKKFKKEKKKFHKHTLQAILVQKKHAHFENPPYAIWTPLEYYFKCTLILDLLMLILISIQDTVVNWDGIFLHPRELY